MEAFFFPANCLKLDKLGKQTLATQCNYRKNKLKGVEYLLTLKAWESDENGLC